MKLASRFQSETTDLQTYTSNLHKHLFNISLPLNCMFSTYSRFLFPSFLSKLFIQTVYAYVSASFDLPSFIHKQRARGFQNHVQSSSKK